MRDFLENKLLAQTDTKTQANSLLKAGAPSSGAKPNPTVRELLDRAAQELAPDKIELNFPRQPLLQAELLQTIGNTYRGIGEHQSGIGFLQRALDLYRQHLGPRHPDTLASMNRLAWAYIYAGKLGLALPLMEETLELCKTHLGLEHPETLTSMYQLGWAYRMADKLDMALPLMEQTLQLSKNKWGLDHPETLRSMNILALVYQAAGKTDLALPLLEQTLELRRARLGPEHPDTLGSMHNLASAYQAAGKLSLALPLCEETCKQMQSKLGPEHPETIESMQDLALAYLGTAVRQAWLSRDRELAATCKKALELAKEANSPMTLEVVAKSCSVHATEDASRRAAALRLARRAVELGKGNPASPWFQLSLGMAEYRSGNYAEADAALATAIGGDSGTAGFYHAMSLFRQGKPDQARQLAQAAAASVGPPPEDEKNPPPETADLNDLILWLAYREAKQLIGFDTTPAAPPQEKVSTARENK